MEIVDEKGFLTMERKEWLRNFLNIRHMSWDTEIINKRGLWGTDEVGEDGMYYAFPDDNMTFNETVHQEGVKESNWPAGNIPTLYSPFYYEDGELEITYSDLNEAKDAYDWLIWINENLFKPVGIVIDDAEFDVQGQEPYDLGRLIIKDGDISWEEGIDVYSVKDIPDEIILSEGKRRNLGDYSVAVVNAIEWAINVGEQAVKDLVSAMALTSEDLTALGYDKDEYPYMYREEE